MYQVDEEEIRKLQKIIPNATPENIGNFKNCMSNEGVFAAMSYAVAGSTITYFFLPIKLKQMRPVISGVVGLAMYMVGKISYVPVCYKKAFGTLSPATLPDFRQPHTELGYNDTLSQQEQQSKLQEPSDNFITEQPLWSNYDAQFESTSTEFSSDGNNNLEENESTKPVKPEKERVTYDDLWKEYQKGGTSRKYNTILGHLSSNNNSDPRLGQGRQRFMDETMTSEAEAEDRNIWS